MQFHDIIFQDILILEGVICPLSFSIHIFRDGMVAAQ